MSWGARGDARRLAGVSYGNAKDHKGGNRGRENFVTSAVVSSSRTLGAPVQLCWSTQARGWVRQREAGDDMVGVTLCMVINGALWFRFTEGYGRDKKEITLSRPGDYVMWNDTVDVECQALRTVNMLSVKWNG